MGGMQKSVESFSRAHTVVVANSRLSLVKALSDSLGLEVFHTDLHNFADSESRVPLEMKNDLRGKHVILVPQFSFGCKEVCKDSINEQILELLLLAHQVKARRAQKITAVMPYLPYSRQSRSFDGMFVGPLQAIGFFCKEAGIDRVFACELHEPLCHSIFPIPICEMYLQEIWFRTLQEYCTADERAQICFFSPDRGGINRVKRIAHLFNAEWAFVEKRRVDVDQSKALDLVGDVSGKVVVMIDDIIDTGITAVEAAKMAVEYGARKVIACCTHAILSVGAVEAIQKSVIQKVWVTNSVLLESSVLGAKIEVVSIDDFIVQELKSFLMQ